MSAFLIFLRYSKCSDITLFKMSQYCKRTYHATWNTTIDKMGSIEHACIISMDNSHRHFYFKYSMVEQFESELGNITYFNTLLDKCLKPIMIWPQKLLHSSHTDCLLHPSWLLISDWFKNRQSILFSPTYYLDRHLIMTYQYSSIYSTSHITKFFDDSVCLSGGWMGSSISRISEINSKQEKTLYF